MTPMDILKLVVGYTLAVFIGLLGLAILWKIYKNDIKLDHLISDADNKASLSRFQFLVFTFVISLSLFLVIAANNGFPETIPGEIFALLGISGGSYLISKGVDSNERTRKAEIDADKELARGKYRPLFGGKP